MDRKTLESRLDDQVLPFSDRVWEMYNAPFARMMGIEVEHIGMDSVTCSMVLTPEHMNSMQRGHGGAVYALIDHTFAFATNIDSDCTGIETSVSFHRPAFGKLTAVAKPVNRSRSLQHFSVEVRSEEGKLVASAKCVSFVLRRD